MPPSSLYRILVPNAPAHRRTERDASGGVQIEFHAAAVDARRKAARQPGVQKPRLISSFQGSIDTLLLSFPAYSFDDSDLAPAYQSLIREMRVGTRFVVIHPRGRQADAEAWFQEAGHPVDNVIYVPLFDFVRFTDWAEDPFVALMDADDETHYLMEPWAYLREADKLIAEAVQEHTDIRAIQAPLIFQGGNCLIGDDFWLLGKDYFADSDGLITSSATPVQIPDGVTPEAFTRQLFAEYVEATRKLFVVGTAEPVLLGTHYGTREGDDFYLDIVSEGVGRFQPIFHIDMFITLVGRNDAGDFEVLVGSPSLGDRLLGTESPFSLGKVYDAIAEDLAAQGFKVCRNPLVHRPTFGDSFSVARLREMAKESKDDLPYAIEDLVAAGADDSTTIRVRDWDHFTWNNCLVENSAARGRHVYLPTFGHSNADLAPIDDYTEDLWRRLGFEVHRLGDFSAFARRQGVVHCIKKYLSRGD